MKPTTKTNNFNNLKLNTPLEYFLLNFPYKSILNFETLSCSNQIYFDFYINHLDLFYSDEKPLFDFSSSLNCTFEDYTRLTKCEQWKTRYFGEELLKSTYNISINRNIDLNVVITNQDFNWDINGLMANVNFLDLTFSEEILNLHKYLKNSSFSHVDFQENLEGWYDSFGSDKKSLKNYLIYEPYEIIGNFSSYWYEISVKVKNFKPLSNEIRENIPFQFYSEKYPILKEINKFLIDFNQNENTSKDELECLNALLWCVENIGDLFVNFLEKVLRSQVDKRCLELGNLIIYFFHQDNIVSKRNELFLKELKSVLRLRKQVK